MNDLRETDQTIEINETTNTSSRKERLLDSQLAGLTAKRLDVRLGEPVSQLSDEEFRAYSYALKWGLGLSREDRIARLNMIRGICETGTLPEHTDEILAKPGAISLLQENDQKQIRMSRAISAVRETIKGIAPQFLRSRTPVPHFFMEGYRCAINGGPREPITPSTLPEPVTHVVFEATEN